MCLCNFSAEVGRKIVRLESFVIFFHSYGKEKKSEEDGKKEKNNKEEKRFSPPQVSRLHVLCVCAYDIALCAQTRLRMH